MVIYFVSSTMMASIELFIRLIFDFVLWLRAITDF